MINRSLIRIKTVQILYSYLLTLSDFRLAPAPDAEASRDRRFAYSVHQDFIILLLKLSSIPVGVGNGMTLLPDQGIKKNRVGRALAANNAVQAMLAANRDRFTIFDSCLEDLMETIGRHPLYAAYRRKRKLTMADDVDFWNSIFTEVVRKHKGVERVLRRDENFSHVGFDQGLKLLATTLGGFDDTRASYDKARNDLDESLRRAYDLYHALLVLPIALTELQLERQEAAKKKYLPKEEELNPSSRFTGNLLVQALRNCTALTDYTVEHPEADPATWRDFDIAATRILDSIIKSKLYAEYMDSPAGDFATDAAFWREVLRSIVLPSDDFAELMETKSVYWNDDLAIMSTFALKTIRRSYAAPKAEGEDADDAETSAGQIELLPMFMNTDDERFGACLFELVVENREKYRALIDSFINSEQWDSERLAFMDIVVMMTAIAEIINFPSIPVPVTMNEYIEIANDYSTPKSGLFINGILFSVVRKLNDDGIISK